jgi:hypothetical protein
MRVVTLASDKTYLKSKAMKVYKEVQCLIIKRTIWQEDVTILNMYVSQVKATRYIEQVLKHLKKR